MYLGAMSCEIKIGKHYTIRGMEQVEIKKSVHQIVQTAKLTLPLSYVMRNKDLKERVKLIDKIKEGDSISVAIGYDGNNNTEFTGYIRRINPKQPLELELEDELYLFRKLRLNKSFKKNDVSDIVKYLIGECNKTYGVSFKLYANMPKLTVTNFLINGGNGLSVLQELSDKYGLSSFITTINGEKTLYCGLNYGLKKKRVKYFLNRNTMSIDDLKFNTGDDITYKIKAVNHQPNGLVYEYDFGDQKGQEIKMHFYGSHTKDELKLMAEAELKKFSTAGYKGSFNAYMFPAIEPCDIAVLEDSQFANRGGNYYVCTVTTTFGTSGGSRKNEIDFKL